MAGLLTETVTAYFDLTAQGGAFFTLDDPVKGVLDNVTYLLAGNTATDVSQYIRSVQSNRGRTRALDDTPAGVAQTVADNRLRTFDPNYAAGPYFGNIRPGKRVTFATNGVTTFDGLIDDWNFDYQIDDSTAQFDTVDALASLGAKEFDEWVTVDGQLQGARLGSVLDRTEVQFPASRNIGTGSATLQDDLVTWGSNVLNYAQLVAKCDLGQLFVAKDGTLTFYGGDRVLTGVGAPVLTDDVVARPGIVYSGINVDYGTELLFNRVSVDAIGFNKQTVINQTSIDLYGVRSLSIPQLPLQTEAQALNLANTLLNLYAFPLSRIATVTVDLHALSSADQSTVLNVDIGTVVETVYTPNKVSTALDQYGLVEGISHLIGPLFHSVTFHLTRLADGLYGASPFILDDAFYGVLDTAGHGVLAY